MHEFSEAFPYWNALAAGRPLADSARHPRMPIPHRAKIFQPFDALEGFSVSIAADGEIATVYMTKGTVADALDLAVITADDDDILSKPLDLELTENVPLLRRNV